MEGPITSQLEHYVYRSLEKAQRQGAEVEHASAAIGGDPIEFRLFGCGISLRQEHARHFRVAPVGAGD